MLSKDRVKYYTELPSQPFETGKSVFMYEVRQMAEELLSLREQLAELKEWATNRAITDDARENENYTTLKIDYRQRQLRELLKTAKPAED
ncbi:hypothetical protein [Yersinia enterocolitica]|uniref:hypothetical protein n=1 Tax=Yersinia enterocolitica TaxID=630 RepID=UPI003D00060F